MRLKSRLCRFFLFIVGCFFVPFLAAVTLDVAQVEENKKIAEVSGDQAAATTYSKVLSQLKIAELARNDAVLYSTSIDKFVDQIDELSKRYSTAFQPSILNPDSLVQFDLLFGQLDAEFLRLQKKQVELNQSIVAIGDRSAQVPQEIQALNQEETALPSAAVTTGNAIQDEAISQYRQASLMRIATQREALEMERLSSKNRIELARKELRLVETQIARLEELRADFLQRRQVFSENQFQQLRNQAQSIRQQVTDSQELIEFADKTLELLDQLNRVEAQWRNSSVRRQEFEKTIAELASSRKTFEEERSVSSASAMLGVPLIERYDNLLRTVHLDEEQLKEVHAARLGLAEMAPSSVLLSAELSLDKKQEIYYQQLRELYQEAFDTTTQYYDDLVLELVRFNGSYAEMLLQAEELRRVITKNSLWVTNVSPIDLPWLRQVAVSSVKFFGTFYVDVLIDLRTSFNSLKFEHLYLLLTIPAYLFRRNLRRRLHTVLPVWAQKIGIVREDRINETLYVLLATFALAIFWVMPFVLLSQYFAAIDQGSGHSMAFSHMFSVVARFLLVVRFLMFASLPYSFFAAHLRFPETLIRSLLKPLRWAEWVGGLLVAACLLVYQWPEPTVMAGIGRFLFLFLAIFVSGWIWFLVGEIQRVAVYLNMKPLWLTIARLVLPALPVIGVFAIAMGYFSLAQQLLGNSHQTLLALLVVLIGFMVIRRVFAIQERRVTYERAVERREEELTRRKKINEESSSESPIEIEEFEVDTAVLRSRSMSLLQLAALAVFLGFSAQIWSEFLLAFDWLNNISLWETLKTVGDTQTVRIITLADLLGMLIIFAVTVILAMNLPSLIDLLILQNMRLEPGVGFAVMTVTSYIVVVVGVLAGFSAIGMDWSKMQWLVAALGLGVGFGLQEIVANLVSGLIILFERPIRLGDLITVQGESGTVSRIRMRATTIVDFDRREIVVPNKILLSEKITNWSLTDGITRVVVNVGVAYGSDVELVERLLLQAAKESLLILSEPAPEVFFNAFGNSTLDFELRVFSAEIGRRMPARDDLHHRIIKLFEENGIVIAFPQMDVHIVSDNRRDPGNAPV